MSISDKNESNMESLQLSLKGWEEHPDCEIRTRIIEELKRDIEILKQAMSSN